MRPGCVADHSPPPIAEVMNAWSYASILAYALMACTWTGLPSVKVKKIKFTIEQAMKIQRGSKSIALLFL